MDFAGAVSTCLRKYATLNGRARRSEYWWFFLFTSVTGIAVDVVGLAAGSPTDTVLSLGFVLALLLPGIAVGVRRLHDTGRSGWMVLIAFIPLVGAIVLVVFYCRDGQPFPNKYGPSPKYDAAGPHPAYYG